MSTLDQLIYDETQAQRKEIGKQKLTVAKRNDLIQQLRFDLSRNEQLCVLYAISKIKPTDNIYQEYEFDILEFQRLIEIEEDFNIYPYIKRILKNIRDKSAWATSADGKTESVVSWFSNVKITNGTGKVKVRFHEELQPYLIDLHRQYIAEGKCYTTYSLLMVLKMKSKYGIRLYELIKSYANNPRWTFDPQTLKTLLCAFDKDGNPLIPKTWNDFNHFRNKVIEPAIADINNCSDLHIGYDTIREGRKVVQITFFFAHKSEEEMQAQFSSNQKRLGLDSFDEDKYQEALRLMTESKEDQFRREHPFRPQLPSVY